MIIIFKPVKNLAAVNYVGKTDGIIALVFIAVYAFASFFTLKKIPVDDKYIYVQILVQMAWLAVIAMMVVLRKQGWISLGFKKERIPYIATIGFTLVVLVYSAWKSNYEILGRWLFYLIAVGGMEEVLFRGYTYPRVVRLFNSHWIALVVTGMLFGAMHQIAPMVWDNAPWYGVFNHIGGGILGSLIFLLIYALTGNIMNAIIFHAAMDFTACMGILSIVYVVILILYKNRKHLSKK